MINVYGGFGLVPGARNTWSYWIDHILKQRERFGFVAATMITTQGVVSAFTKDFLPTTAEVQVKMTFLLLLLQLGCVLCQCLKLVRVASQLSPQFTSVSFHLST